DSDIRAVKRFFTFAKSSAYQVTHNLESQKLQHAMQERLSQLGWREIEVVDEDLGPIGCRNRHARGIRAYGVGSLSGPWESQQLVEICRVVDTVLIDQETVYSPRQSNDRLLLGLKGSLN